VGNVLDLLRFKVFVGLLTLQEVPEPIRCQNEEFIVLLYLVDFNIRLITHILTRERTKLVKSPFLPIHRIPEVPILHIEIPKPPSGDQQSLYSAHIPLAYYYVLFLRKSLT